MVHSCQHTQAATETMQGEMRVAMTDMQVSLAALRQQTQEMSIDQAALRQKVESLGCDRHAALPAGVVQQSTWPPPGPNAVDALPRGAIRGVGDTSSGGLCARAPAWCQ